MNRNEEYKALLTELEQTPKELENTVQKAMKRENTSRKKRRAWGISCVSLAACFACFVLLVNLSVPFARACGNIPVLRELAKAVSWSPSLSAAVENEYVQPIGQSQTENGITATIEYVIVDRKQVNIFFTLDSKEHAQLEADSRIELPGGGYSCGSSSYGTPNGELRSVRVDFIEWDVPDTLDLVLSVWAQEPERDEPAEAYDIDAEFDTPDWGPDYLAEFTFALTFDLHHTAQGKVIPVDAVFSLDGQALTLAEVELYPTHLRVNLEDDPANAAWLTGLELYLENERGERFYAGTNGVSATGDPDGEGMGTFWLDSPFFSQGEHLTLCITRAKWRDKTAPQTKLDLRKGTAENLPEGVRFLGAEERPSGWLVSFAAPLEAENRMYSLFESQFYLDENGESHDIMQFGSTYGVEDPLTGERTDGETMFTENFLLQDFRGDVVYLEPLFDKLTAFDPPVTIPIK